MENNTQPLVRQLYSVYRYILLVDGISYSEVGVLLDEVGDGLDYGTLANGMEVLVQTGLVRKDGSGYAAIDMAEEFESFLKALESGLSLNQSQLLADTFENEGIRKISPEGDVEYWKAYIQQSSRYILPYLEGLGLISFAESGRIIRLPRESIAARYIIDSIRKSSKRRKSLDTLLKELEEKRVIGALGESIAFAYERKRLKSLGRIDSPELISNDYVNAGYDIQSYENLNSKKYDRFIEVKAVGSDGQFYLSRNELEKAKIYKKSYFLYLVDVTRSVPDNPVIEIIGDTVSTLFAKESDWMNIIESYRFERLGTNQEISPNGIRSTFTD